MGATHPRGGSASSARPSGAVRERAPDFLCGREGMEGERKAVADKKCLLPKGAGHRSPEPLKGASEGGEGAEGVANFESVPRSPCPD